MGHYEVIDSLKELSEITNVITHLLQLFVTQKSPLISRAASFGGTGVHELSEKT